MLDAPSTHERSHSESEPERATIRAALDALAAGRLEEVEACRARLAPTGAWHAVLGAALAQSRGRLDEALALWDAALSRDPALVTARHNRARLLEHLGRLEEAVAELEEARRLAPEDAEIAADLGRVAWRLGRLEGALDALEAALARDPDLVPALNDRALVLRAMGRREEAYASLARVLARDPGYRPARTNELCWLLEDGRVEEAVEASEAALAAGAVSAEILYFRGCALRGIGRTTAALAALDRALELDPHHARARCERGLVLLELDRDAEALAAFEALQANTAGDAVGQLGLAMALHRLGRAREALVAIDRALALAPRYPQALVERGNILRTLGRPREALLAYDAALALLPGNPHLETNRGNVLLDTGHLREAREAFERALALAPNSSLVFHNLLWCICYDPTVERSEAIRWHRAFGERFGHRPDRYRDWPNPPTADRPLRIGFVSADLCRHPVGFVLLAVVEALDRERFPLVFYSAGSLEDRVTERLRAAAATWHRVGGLSDRGLAELVRADGVDILIDLSGHTAGSRLPAFALKPAPVQASWLGYPFTTGLPEIDWILMDPISVPPGEEDAFVERVARLPHRGFVLRPPEGAPEPVLPPALTNGRVTFGSFNNLSKMTEEVIEVWAAILRRLPSARLLLKWKTLAEPAVADEVRAAYAARGIDPERLILRGASGYAQMLAEYGEVDIALDPFPFGGGQTTLDALWMGVPVVTLPRWQPVSRQGAMLLDAIARPEWIADDPEDYVEVAVELAEDPGYLAGIRLGQREQVRRSPLLDARHAARELERTLTMMWDDWLVRRST